MTAKEYQSASDKAIPHSKSYRNIPMAFLVGGLLCVLGQAVMNLCLYYGMEKDIASACASMSLIILSAVLTGCNIYDNIAQHAGAGTLVPITGFANSMVSPAMEFKTEGYVLGLGAKMFSIAGPVLVYGVSASVIYGLILFIFGR
ncbi:MAG: stage V sporulation protein AC [Negativibacillus sp.]